MFRGEVPMADRHPTHKLKLFRWLLPLIYVGVLGILIIGSVLGAGHTPAALQFLISVINAPCYLLEFLLPGIMVPNAVVGLIICVTFGILFFIAIGLVVDLLMNRRRS